MPKYLCKQFSFDEIIKCTFNLSDSELRVLIELMKCKNKQCVNSIGTKLKRDRSTVQKILIKLLNKDLVEKKKSNLTDGGYIFFYLPKSKEELKKQMLESVNSWHNSVKKEIIKW